MERKKGRGWYSFGAWNLAQLENEWHFNPPGPQDEGSGGDGGVHHCETIQRKKEGKRGGKNETERIGSVESRSKGREVKTQRRLFHEETKGDRGRVERGRERTRVSRVCSNTNVPCTTFHLRRLFLFAHPSSSPFRPLRVEGLASSAPLHLHCIIHTRDTRVLPRERTRPRTSTFPPPLMRGSSRRQLWKRESPSHFRTVHSRIEDTRFFVSIENNSLTLFN